MKIVSVCFQRRAPALPFVLGLLSMIGNLSYGVIAPADRQTTWQGNVGVPGGIPNRTTIFVNLQTTSNSRYKCAANGSTDDSAAIVNAINDCPSGQVVYAPAGTYFCPSGIRIYNKSGWTLRGAGPGNTIFTGGGSALFNIGNSPWLSSWPAATAITGGANKGATSITVASTANLKVNEIAWIEEPNDGNAVFGFGLGGGTGAVNADDRMHNNAAVKNTRVMVTAISGSTVTFNPPLAYDFNVAGGARIAGYGGQVGPTFAGLEDLTANGSPSGEGIAYQSCYGCWFKNVELKGYSTFGFEFGWSACCEIRHCYVHEPADYNWSHGYAIQYDCANNFLAEDNIIWKNETGFIIQGGSGGNVFGYNFMFQVYNVYGGLQHQGESLYSNHTPYPTMNLWEGNCGSGFQEDFYYGPSSRTTLLRNYLHCADPDITDSRVAVSIDSHQWSNSVVGNVLGSSGTHATIHAALPNINISWANQTPQNNWVYDPGTSAFSYGQNVIYRLGYPFSGNTSSGGASADGTTNNLNFIDLLVRTNTIIHGNYDAAHKAIVWDPTISDHNIPNSYYLAGKPSWFGNLPWPPYDPANPSSCDLTNIPAGYRFIYGVDPAAGPINNPPVASASANPVRGSAPLAVAFSSAGSSDPEGTSLTYNWTFGDGTSSTAANPSHTYNTANTYSAHLTVSDGTNSVNSSNISISVNVAGSNYPPIAVSSATPTSGFAPLSVAFSSAGSSDPDGTTLTYNWTFGDGSSSTSANPSHTYSSNGLYTAQLRVSDGTNTVAASPITINVANAASYLVAAYAFEEGSGASVSDSSGNGNIGSISNATWVTTGKYGKALSFNGGYVTVNDTASLELTTNITIEAWVNPSAAPTGWQVLAYKGGNDYYLAGSNPSSVPTFGGNFATTSLTAGTALPANTWTHLACTYDGATMTIYTNGIPAASQAQTGPLTTSTGTLSLGGDPVRGNFWRGMMDEVRIYRRTLSQTDIHNDMNAPLSGAGSRPNTPQNFRVAGP